MRFLAAAALAWLAFAPRAAHAFDSGCFASDWLDQPRPVPCPEQFVASDPLPPPPAGTVWLPVPNRLHVYKAERLMRRVGGAIKFVPGPAADAPLPAVGINALGRPVPVRYPDGPRADGGREVAAPRAPGGRFCEFVVLAPGEAASGDYYASSRGPCPEDHAARRLAAPGAGRTWIRMGPKREEMRLARFVVPSAPLGAAPLASAFSPANPAAPGPGGPGPGTPPEPEPGPVRLLRSDDGPTPAAAPKAAAPAAAAAPSPTPAPGRPVVGAPAAKDSDWARAATPRKTAAPPSPLVSVTGALAAVLLLGAGIGYGLGRRRAPAAPASAFSSARWSSGPTGPAMPEFARGTPPTPTAPATPSTPTARVLRGRYELKGKIGEGGMGVVFEGWDHTLGRRVAVKAMRAELSDGSQARDAFLTEAKIISHLSHPYIVSIHEVVEESDGLYLVFDFVDGQPLSAILRKRGRLPLDECAKTFGFVCEAIASAHRGRVLHRDLKPSNIMIDSAGYAKVMDFGIAREAKDTITRLTALDAAGTPAYMAPEQHLGRAAKASDIYALGVCLYEALTGSLPFPGPDFLAQKERMKYAPPQFLAPDLPKNAELLFAAALAADPKQRPADAGELAETLKSLRA